MGNWTKLIEGLPLHYDDEFDALSLLLCHFFIDINERIILLVTVGAFPHIENNVAAPAF